MQIFDHVGRGDCMDYKEYLALFTARFVSEEPTFGAVTRPSMLKMMTEDDLLHDPDEKIFWYHTKTNPCLKYHLFDDVRSFARKLLGEFADGEDVLPSVSVLSSVISLNPSEAGVSVVASVIATGSVESYHNTELEILDDCFSTDRDI